MGGRFVCRQCMSFVGGGLMFMGGGCRSGMGGHLFIVLSSCCVIHAVAVRREWEMDGYLLE